MNASDLQKRVEQIRRDSEKVVQGAEPDFRQRLKEATQRQLSRHQRSRIEANVAASDESFAAKLSKATKALAARRPETCKQHYERAEKERARYRKLTRRPHTKSE